MLLSSCLPLLNSQTSLLRTHLHYSLQFIHGGTPGKKLFLLIAVPLVPDKNIIGWIAGATPVSCIVIIYCLSPGTGTQ